MDVATVLVAVLTLVAGALIGLLYGRSRSDAAHRTRLAVADAAGRDAVLRVGSELAQARAEVSGLHATLEAERAAADAREIAIRDHAQVQVRERDEAQARAAESQARSEQQLREAFGALAGDALQRNNEAFAELAAARLATVKEGADGDLAQRQQAIEGMVGPLRESLERVQQQLNSVERARAGSYEKLLEQVGTMRQTSEQLRLETTQLVTALRAPQVRGKWGEMQLERVVEAAGMTEQIDYVTQETVTGPDGKLRPDMVVRLVGGKNVVVDSKVAFSGYLEAMEARDEATRATRLKAHARHLREHIDQLASKSYWEHFTPSPEFVVLFVPADAFLDAALREDPTLLERAFDRDVVVATPSTLVALLRTIAYTWRQEALAENAAEVHKLGRDLYQRLSTMGGHIDKLGRSLNSAVGNYNNTVASLESRVLVTARKMIDLEVVKPEDAIVTPAQITEVPRTAQAHELVEQRVVALKPARVSAGQGELLVGDPGEEHRATS